MAKKKILSIILAAAIAVAGAATLTSCSKGDDKKAETTTAAQAEKTEAAKEDKKETKTKDSAEKIKAVKDIVPGKTAIRDLDDEFWDIEDICNDEADKDYSLIPLEYIEYDAEALIDEDVIYYAEIKKGSSNMLGDFIIESIEPMGDSFDFDGIEIEFGATVQDMIDAGLSFDDNFDSDNMLGNIGSSLNVVTYERIYEIDIFGAGDEEGGERPITEATFEYVGYAW